MNPFYKDASTIAILLLSSASIGLAAYCVVKLGLLSGATVLVVSP